MTSRTGFSPERPVNASARSRLPAYKAGRMGVPVKKPLPWGTWGRVSSKLTQTLSVKRLAMRLLSPGEKSDSCATTGTLPAPSTTGTETNPPLLKITSGRISRTNFFA